MSSTYQFCIEDYRRLDELNLFQDARVELVEGAIIHKSAKGHLHSACNSVLLKILLPPLIDKAVVRNQEPINLPPNSEPEPDLVIARYQDDDYRSGHPTAADVLVVIEVSDSTLDYDRTTKLKLYASAGIEHYWIVNLVDFQLEWWSEPEPTKGQYLACRFFHSFDTIQVPGFDVWLPLEEVLHN